MTLGNADFILPSCRTAFCEELEKQVLSTLSCMQILMAQVCKQTLAVQVQVRSETSYQTREALLM